MSDTTYEKLSSLVKYQLPEFVRDSYPIFQTFLEKYYEFTEQEGNVQYGVQNAKAFANIDETANAFVDYFLSQYAYNLPESIFKDQLNQEVGLVSNTIDSKRAIAKRLSDYHGAKGSEGAIRLLYRLLFDDEIVFYYPKEDILKPSDASWGQVKTIHLYDIEPNVTIDISGYGGSIVEGKISGATAVLDSLFSEKVTTANVVLFEMKVDEGSLSGNFILGEPLFLKTANITTGTLELIGNLKFYNAISSIDIIDSGFGYNKGALFYNNSVSVDNFLGEVSRVDDTGQIQKFDIDTAVNLSSEFSNSTPPVLVINDIQKTYYGRFETLGNVAFIAAANNSPTSNVIVHGLDKGDFINVQFTTGLVIPGTIYPVNSVITSKRFTVASTGLTSNVRGNVTLHPRQANLQVNLGAITTYPGAFNDKNSHLSDIKKVQDSDYYQDFSYVIRANQSSALWKDIIKKSVHPAGMKLITEIFISLSNAFTATSVTATIPVDALVTRRIQFNPTTSVPLPSVVPLSQLIIESFGSVSRSVYKHRSTLFYTLSLDKFKFYNTSLRISDIPSMTYNDPFKLVEPQIHLSSQTYQGQSNIILNSRFDSLANWSVPSGFTISLSNLEGTAATGNVSQGFSCDANAKYMATYEIRSLSAGSVFIAANTRPDANVFVGTSRNSPGIYSELFWLAHPTANIIISGTGFTGNISNVHVKKMVNRLG